MVKLAFLIVFLATVLADQQADSKTYPDGFVARTLVSAAPRIVSAQTSNNVSTRLSAPRALRLALPPSFKTWINEISESGRCADLSQDPDSRVSPPSAVAPGPPPVLSFRYYEGKLHHRFENADLMLDDAGH